MAEEQNKPTTAGAPDTGAEDQAIRETRRRPEAAPQGDNRQFKKNPRPGRGSRFERQPKAKPEFDQKIIDIRRVTRVVAGGRRFSFSVVIVIGDRKGSVGVGIGKAGDTSLAIDKAMKNARKHLFKVPATKTMSIPYEVSAKFSSSRVTISPTPGRGIVAGSSVRSVIELAGLKDVGAKIRSKSKNKLNNARVAIIALKQLTPHRRVLLSRRAAPAAPVKA